MNKFFEPLRGKMSKDMMLVLIIANLGIIPATFIGRYANSFLVCAGVFVLWYVLVYFIYLTYCYFKNK